MHKFLFVLLTFYSCHSIAVDDASNNAVANKIKAKVMTKLKKYPHLEGFCDLFIEMKHGKNKAFVVKVKTHGDYELCKISKKIIKIGASYRYQVPEKYIRLHIVP